MRVARHTGGQPNSGTTKSPAGQEDGARLRGCDGVATTSRASSASTSAVITSRSHRRSHRAHPPCCTDDGSRAPVALFTVRS